MNINILLPHKEIFEKDKLSSVSITVKNNFVHSKFKNNIKIYGQHVENPIFKENFVGIKNPKLFFKSKNKNLAFQMCKKITNEDNYNTLIEIHNRPYLIHFICKKFKVLNLTLFLHNDPLQMRGSKSTSERIEILKNVKKVYCVSNYIKQRFLEGIHKDYQKVVTLYNGISFKNKILRKKKLIIFVGKISYEKGAHLFANVVNQIANLYKNWEFKLIGSSQLGSNNLSTAYAKNIVHQFKNIGKNAKYLGFVSNKKVNEIMEIASIVIVPSLWKEPFGLVAAEAMSKGAAVIASNTGGLKEVVGKYGITIDDINESKLKEEIISLIEKKSMLEKIQKISFENFNFKSKDISKKLDGFREELIHFLYKD